MRFTNLEQIRDAANASTNAAPEKSDLDLSSLPAFGGEEPSGRAVIDAGYQAAWSWDESRVLVTDRNGVFLIVDRSELLA